ncbi:MAG: DUF4157 domain-containing protein [Minicystis sp.]
MSRWRVWMALVGAVTMSGCHAAPASARETPEEAACAEPEEPAAGGDAADLADLSIPIADILQSTVDTGLSSLATGIVAGYLSYLEQQASERWQKIPAPLVDWLRPHYDIDMDAVRYADDVDTIHGQGITVDQRIYFPRRMDFSRPLDVRWLLHELQHCEQYRKLGGTGPFLVRYAAQAVAKIVEKGCLDVHDFIELEQEADAKALALYRGITRLLARAGAR